MRHLFLIAAPFFALAASAAPAQQEPWPSPAQIQQVKERRATFPVKTLVTSVDWYQPQEAVIGIRAPRALPVRAHPTIAPAAIENATAYADAQKSFALLVWRDGALEVAKYWPGYDRKTRFETASMAKTVTALSIGAAVGAGKIKSVADPISRYVPALAGTRRGALPLSAYLTMTSGIETPPFSGGDDSPYWQYSFSDDLTEAATHWPDTCTALTEFCYANANTHYLGLALQGATGQRYARWLSDRLWGPLGNGEARLWLDHPGGNPRFSGYLMASAEDWLRVGRLILDHGRANGRQLVPAGWIAKMIAPSAANPNYGWQIWRGSPHNPLRRYGKSIRAVVPAAEPFARDDVVYFDGSAGQRVYVIPSEKMVIVRIGTPSFDWDDSRLPNLLLAGISAPVPALHGSIR